MRSLSRSEQHWAELVARNLTLPGVDPGKPALPTRTLPAQKPCDIGLFSDAAAQIDLLDYITQTARMT